MRVLLDGAFFGNGKLEEYALEIHAEDPEFDVSRLSYHPDDVRTEAIQKVMSATGSARKAVVVEQDTMRRDGWTMMVIGRIALMQARHPEQYEAFLDQVDTFNGIEAELRGKGETADELNQLGVQMFLDMLYGSVVVEGRSKAAIESIEAAEATGLDAAVEAHRSALAEDLAAIQEAMAS